MDEDVPGRPTAGGVPAAGAVSMDAVDPASRDAQDALSQYFLELARRFPSGFDPEAAGQATDAAELRPPDGAFVVVRNDERTIGCGGLKRIAAGTAEIKRMWIHREWRDLGLGRRLLEELETIARRMGRDRILLDTNDSLIEAIAMYERAGYRSIERYNDNPYAQRWFAKDL